MVRGDLASALTVGGLLLNGYVAAITEGVCTEADLREVAGQRSFERGQGYVRAVRDLTVLGNRITASVLGTDEYLVVLTIGAHAKVSGVCDCPWSQEGYFCKHCVAVGLAFLATGQPAGQAEPDAGSASAPTSAGRVPKQRTGERTSEAVRTTGLQKWLNSLSRDELLAFVLEQAVEDADLRQRLELRAASDTADYEIIFDRLDDLLDPGGFGEYGYIEAGESRRYARRVDEAVGVVAHLIELGQDEGDQDEGDQRDPEAAVAVAEFAIDLVSEACRHAVDPGGQIWAAAARLMDQHHAACVAEPPDPMELAAFLVSRVVSGDDLPPIQVTAYRDPLGVTGVGFLKDLLTAALEPEPSSPGPSSPAALRALEDLLREVGDTDALIDLISASLSGGGLDELRIAVELESAGRAGEALTWAERGLRASESRDQKIADFVVGRYLAEGRADDALAVRRDAFAAVRDLAAFQRLRAAAEHSGAWPVTREWALDLLRADDEAARSGHRGVVLPAHSILVDVLIAEGELDAAWDAATGRASEEQWLTLADLITPARPADALEVYLRLIQPLKQMTGDKAYLRMARLLLGARECHRR